MKIANAFDYEDGRAIFARVITLKNYGIVDLILKFPFLHFPLIVYTPA